MVWGGQCGGCGTDGEEGKLGPEVQVVVAVLKDIGSSGQGQQSRRHDQGC